MFNFNYYYFFITYLTESTKNPPKNHFQLFKEFSLNMVEQRGHNISQRRCISSGQRLKFRF